MRAIASLRAAQPVGPETAAVCAGRGCAFAVRRPAAVGVAAGVGRAVAVWVGVGLGAAADGLGVAVDATWRSAWTACVVVVARWLRARRVGCVRTTRAGAADAVAAAVEGRMATGEG